MNNSKIFLNIGKRTTIKLLNMVKKEKRKEYYTTVSLIFFLMAIALAMHTLFIMIRYGHNTTANLAVITYLIICGFQIIDLHRKLILGNIKLDYVIAKIRSI